MSPEALEEVDRLHPAASGGALTGRRGDRAVAEDVLQASYLKILDRQYLPRTADLDGYTRRELDAIARELTAALDKRSAG